MEGDLRVYRWSGSQLDPTSGPEADARKEADKKRALTADEVADRTLGLLPPIAWTNFPDWASVGAWFQSLEKDRVAPTAAIQAKAAELTAGKSTDEEKIRALYAFVAADIRYIGVALGQGRYQPHFAAEVLGNQYGDCKDKHTLLAALLAAAGFHADTILIGPGIRFNEAVPMPADFNHAITAVVIGDKTLWLDTTLEVAPFRALLQIERDKQVLRIPLAGTAHLDRTPADLPFPSLQRTEVTGTLDSKGVAKGHFTDTFRGDDEIALRGAIRQVSPGQYDAMAQYLMGSWGFGGKVSHASFTPPARTEEPLLMTFDYERDKPGDDWEHYRIVALDGPDQLPLVDEKDPPLLPIELGTPRTVVCLSRLELPKGWGATPPATIHERSPWVLYDRVYRVEHGTLIEDRTVTFLQKQVPAASWHEYKKFADAAGAGSYPYVQLTRTSATSNTPGPPLPARDNPEAARLVEEASHANEQHQLERSGEFIEKARAMNDQQPFLWSVTGVRDLLRGEVTDAIWHFTRELELHPTEANIYPLLATAQLAQGKRPEAEATLRQSLSTVGHDANASAMLIAMLLEDEKPGDAVSVAEAASKAAPENPRLRALLGRTQLEAGQREAGVATLLPALHEATDPQLVNDIAYELADHGHATEEIEEAVRKAVDQLSAESAAWTLTDAAQNVAEMRARSSLLVATWDTLGWAIYKSPTGHEPARIAEAERLIQAAWHNGPNAELGLHLGEIQEATGRPAEALVSYQLALASSPQFDLRGVHQPPNPMQRDLAARIEGLRKTHPGAAAKDPAAALVAQRKLAAGASTGESRVLPYRLLLNSSGIRDLIPLPSTDGDHGRPEPAKDRARLDRASTRGWIPEGSPARLLRSAVLNCHQADCEVVFSPVAATQ